MISNKYTKQKDHEQRCNKCKSAVFKIQISGVVRELSVESLSVLGELQAKLAKKQTFQIKKVAGKMTGDYRDIYKIQGGRKPNYVVVTTHECGLDFAKVHPDYEIKINYEIPEEPQF